MMEEEPELFDMEVDCENGPENSTDYQSSDNQYQEQVAYHSATNKPKVTKIIYIEEDSSDSSSLDSEYEDINVIRQKHSVQKITIESIGQKNPVYLKRKVPISTLHESVNDQNVKYSSVFDGVTSRVNDSELKELVVTNVENPSNETFIEHHSNVIDETIHDDNLSELTEVQITNMMNPSFSQPSCPSPNETPIVHNDIVCKSVEDVVELNPKNQTPEKVKRPSVVTKTKGVPHKQKSSIGSDPSSFYYPSSFKLGVVQFAKVRNLHEAASLFKIPKEVLNDWVILENKINQQFSKDNYSGWEKELFIHVIFLISNNETVTLKDVIEKGKSFQIPNNHPDKVSTINWAIDWCKQFRFQLDHKEGLSELSELKLPGSSKFCPEPGNRDNGSDKNRCTPAFKLEILTYAELHSIEECAKKFNLRNATIQRWFSQQEVIGKLAEQSSVKLKRKHTTEFRHESLENELFEWYQSMEQKGKATRQSLIASKARSLARKLNLEDFEPTCSWYNEWSKSYLKTKREPSVKEPESMRLPEDPLQLKNEWDKLLKNFNPTVQEISSINLKGNLDKNLEVVNPSKKIKIDRSPETNETVVSQTTSSKSSTTVSAIKNKLPNSNISSVLEIVENTGSTKSNAITVSSQVEKNPKNPFVLLDNMWLDKIDPKSFIATGFEQKPKLEFHNDKFNPEVLTVEDSVPRVQSSESNSSINSENIGTNNKPHPNSISLFNSIGLKCVNKFPDSLVPTHHLQEEGNEIEENGREIGLKNGNQTPPVTEEEVVDAEEEHLHLSSDDGDAENQKMCSPVPSKVTEERLCHKSFADNNSLDQKVVPPVPPEVTKEDAHYSDNDAEIQNMCLPVSSNVTDIQGLSPKPSINESPPSEEVSAFTSSSQNDDTQIESFQQIFLKFAKDEKKKSNEQVNEEQPAYESTSQSLAEVLEEPDLEDEVFQDDLNYQEKCVDAKSNLILRAVSPRTISSSKHVVRKKRPHRKGLNAFTRRPKSYSSAIIRPRFKRKINANYGNKIKKVVQTKSTSEDVCKSGTKQPEEDGTELPTYPACFQRRVIEFADMKGEDAASQEYGLPTKLVRKWRQSKLSIKMLSEVELFQEWELDLYVLVYKLKMKGATVPLSELISKGKNVLDALTLSDCFVFENEQALDWCERFGVTLDDEPTEIQKTESTKPNGVQKPANFTPKNSVHHRQKFSTEFMLEVCDYGMKHSNGDTSMKYGVPISTIRSWILKRDVLLKSILPKLSDVAKKSEPLKLKTSATRTSRRSMNGGSPCSSSAGTRESNKASERSIGKSNTTIIKKKRNFSAQKSEKVESLNLHNRDYLKRRKKYMTSKPLMKTRKLKHDDDFRRKVVLCAKTDGVAEASARYNVSGSVVRYWGGPMGGCLKISPAIKAQAMEYADKYSSRKASEKFNVSASILSAWRFHRKMVEHGEVTFEQDQVVSKAAKTATIEKRITQKKSSLPAQGVSSPNQRKSSSPAHGVSSPNLRKFSPEFIHKVLAYARSHSFTSASNKYSVPRSTVYVWGSKNARNGWPSTGTREQLPSSKLKSESPKVKLKNESGDITPDTSSSLTEDIRIMEEQVFAWYQLIKTNEGPVGGSNVIAKAKAVASELNLDDSIVNRGWYKAWNQKYSRLLSLENSPKRKSNTAFQTTHDDSICDTTSEELKINLVSDSDNQSTGLRVNDIESSSTDNVPSSKSENDLLINSTMKSDTTENRTSEMNKLNVDAPKYVSMADDSRNTEASTLNNSGVSSGEEKEKIQAVHQKRLRRSAQLRNVTDSTPTGLNSPNKGRASRGPSRVSVSPQFNLEADPTNTSYKYNSKTAKGEKQTNNIGTIIVITDPGVVFCNWLKLVNEEQRILKPADVFEEIEFIVDKTHEDYFDNWLFRLYHTKVNAIPRTSEICGSISSVVGLDGYLSADVRLQLVAYSERRGLDETSSCFQVCTNRLCQWKESESVLNRLVMITNLFSVNNKNSHIDLDVYEWYIKAMDVKVGDETFKVNSQEIYKEHGGKSPNKWYFFFPGRFQKIILFDLIERKVLEEILQQFDLNWSLSKEEIIVCFNKFLTEQCAKSLFPTPEIWFEQFCDRYQSFLVQTSNARDLASEDLVSQAKRFSESVIEMQHELPLNCIGSMDEIPFSLGPKIVLKSDDSPSVYNQSFKRCDGVVLLSCLANGDVLSPFIVFKHVSKRTKVQAEHVEINDSVLSQWIEKIWLPHVSQPKSILILDSFLPHLSPKFQQLALESNVQLSFVPAGCNSLVHPMSSALLDRFEALLLEAKQTKFHSVSMVLEKNELIDIVNDAHSEILKEPDMVKRCFQDLLSISSRT